MSVCDANYLPGLLGPDQLCLLTVTYLFVYYLPAAVARLHAARVARTCRAVEISFCASFAPSPVL